MKNNAILSIFFSVFLAHSLLFSYPDEGIDAACYTLDRSQSDVLSNSYILYMLDSNYDRKIYKEKKIIIHGFRSKYKLDNPPKSPFARQTKELDNHTITVKILRTFTSSQGEKYHAVKVKRPAFFWSRFGPTIAQQYFILNPDHSMSAIYQCNCDQNPKLEDDILQKSLNDIRLLEINPKWNFHKDSEKSDSSSSSDDKGLCCICLDHTANILLRPCNHLAICEKCISLCKKKCPICRVELEGKEKIFLN